MLKLVNGVAYTVCTLHSKYHLSRWYDWFSINFWPIKIKLEIHSNWATLHSLHPRATKQDRTTWPYLRDGNRYFSTGKGQSFRKESEDCGLQTSSLGGSFRKFWLASAWNSVKNGTMAPRFLWSEFKHPLRSLTIFLLYLRKVKVSDIDVHDNDRMTSD